MTFMNAGSSGTGDSPVVGQCAETLAKIVPILAIDAIATTLFVLSCVVGFAQRSLLATVFSPGAASPSRALLRNMIWISLLALLCIALGESMELRTFVPLPSAIKLLMCTVAALAISCAFGDVTSSTVRKHQAPAPLSDPTA